MTEKKMLESVIAKAGDIVRILKKGKDVEIRKTASGITVAEVSRKVSR